MSKKKHSRHSGRAMLPIGEQLAAIEKVNQLLTGIRERKEKEENKIWEAQRGRPVDPETAEIVQAMGRMTRNRESLDRLVWWLDTEEKRGKIKIPDIERVERIKETREAIGRFLKEREVAA